MPLRYFSSFLVLFFLEPAFAQRVITTIAGTDWLFPGDGRPAINAPLSGRLGLDVTVDANGNYYIADIGNVMVMRVGSDGIINVIAGNGVNFVSGDGGRAVNAALFQPTAVAVDSGGTVYIAGYGGDIRKVTTDGNINTIAGNGNGGFGGDNGPASKALLDGPFGIAVDSGGNIFIADTNNNRIRKITPDGLITTVAGNGQAGKAGDNGPATAAQLNAPTRIAVDTIGNLYITETANQIIRKVDARGIITTVAGGGTDFGDGGLATNAALIPLAVGVDGAGNLYIVDGFSYGIRKVDTQGRITTIAGGSGNPGFSGDGGPALNARFYFQLDPAVAVDPAGNIFIADEVNERIRRITPDGTINTVAGNGLFHFAGNGGPATSASLDMPTSVIGDRAGNIYFSEPALSRIRRVTPDGAINVYAGNGIQGYGGDNGPATSAALNFPMYLSSDSNGNIYFADSINCVIRRIDSSGIISTYAGSGAPGFSGDGGAPTQATFRAPEGLDFDSVGELVIADTQNQRLRVVFPAGTSSLAACRTATACVLTLAGDGTAGFTGDNGISPRARVNNPAGVRIFNGGIYFADSGNHRIRRIDINTLVITTVAGNGNKGYSGDGGPAINAALNNPQSVNFDSAGNLYIADTDNSVIRRITPAGTISTFAGVKTSAILGDGGLASAAGLGAPTDIFFDSAGNLFFTDLFFNRVREILTNLPSFQVNPTSLAFTAPAGAAATDLGVNLAGSITGVPFTATATSSGGWLRVSPASGVMPATVRVTADPSKLPAGSYQGTVTITAANASPSTRTIAVALTVTAAGQASLSVKPTSMTFPFVQQAPPRTRPLSISNAGGGSLAFTVSTSTTSGGRWLTASPGNGTVSAFGSTSVNITADPTNLGPGTYSGTVTVSSAAGNVIVPVTMTISVFPQTILIPQTGLTFLAVQGGGPALPQSFSILNTGSGQMPFTTQASTLSGGSDWLSVFPGGGVSDADSPLAPPQIRVDVNPGNLAAGIYYGSVQVIATGADNNPQFVSVILNVLPPGSNIGPLVQPTGLIFAAVAGAEPPGSQTVLVQSTNSTPITFHSGRVNGFTTLPPDANVTQAQPVRIVIQPQTSGLAPGVYRSLLTLSFSDGSTRNVALVLVLLPPGSSLPSGQSLAAAAAGCMPTTLAPVFTLLPDGFSIPAGFPGQVTVKVTDDCGNPQTTGGVTVSFSNGDQAIRLISLKDGTWAGTWTPQHNAAQVTVTASAEIPEQKLKGLVQVKGGFQTFDQPPSVFAGGVVSAAASSQSLLAPGSLVSIFGSKLSQGQATATTVPLPTNLGGSSVVLANQSVPLMFTSDGQVNAVVPYGIGINTAQQVIVSRGNSLSVPQPVTVAPAAPGIFALSGTTQGIIVDINGNIVNPAHPVRAGDAIVIYCTGLGEVDPPVTAGTPASMTQLSYTVNQASVTIGGVSVTPLFSGLTPGFVGLYQVNAVVPGGVAPGDQVPVTLTSAGQTSPPVTIAVR